MLETTSFFINALLGVLTIVATVGGWFSRQLWEAIKALQREMKILEIKVASEYVRHDRLQEAFKPIMDALLEIKETLKTKADK